MGRGDQSGTGDLDETETPLQAPGPAAVVLVQGLCVAVSCGFPGWPGPTLQTCPLISLSWVTSLSLGLLLMTCSSDGAGTSNIRGSLERLRFPQLQVLAVEELPAEIMLPYSIPDFLLLPEIWVKAPQLCNFPVLHAYKG